MIWNAMKIAGAVAALLCLSVVSSVQAESGLVIGTGSVAGVYYPTGGAICRFYEREVPSGGRCDVEPTGGSIVNLEGLRDGRYSLAVVQSDWQYYAYTGHSEYEGALRLTRCDRCFRCTVSPLPCWPEAIPVFRRSAT